MTNQVKKSGVVHFYAMAGGGSTVVAEVLEPGDCMRTHSTITTIGGPTPSGHCEWYGLLGTRCLPPDIEALPVGAERSAAVEKHRAHQWHLIEKALDRVAMDPEIAEHCKRTESKYYGYGYAWNDPEFHAYIRSCEDPATYFPVEWTE